MHIGHRRIQTSVDAKIDATAGVGKDAAQSIRAQLGYQPTPESIARAESSLGEGAGNQRALVLLARARILDRDGDAGCKVILEQANRTLAASPN